MSDQAANFCRKDPELAVLNYLMMMPSCRERTFEQVKPEDFWDQRLRTCYEHMLNAWTQKQSLDRPAVQTWYVDNFPEVLEAQTGGTWATSLSALLDQSARRQLYFGLQQSLEQCGDPNHATANIQEELSQLLTSVDSRAATDSYMAPRDAVRLATEKMMANRQAKFRSVPWGLSGLDDMGLLRPGHMIVVAARPGHGKTALFATAANYQLDNGFRPFCYNCEMPVEQVVNRLLSHRCGIPARRIGMADFKTKDECDRHKAASEQLAGLPWDIRAGKRWTISQVCTAAKESVRNYGSNVVYVDYLSAIICDVKKNSIRAEVQHNSMRLKELALDLEVPVIVMAQLNRLAEDVTPQIHHLAECSVIEQDADSVCLLDRPHTRPNPAKRNYYFNRPDREGLTELTMEDLKHHAALILGKNRHGPCGMFFLHYNGPLMLFGEHRFRFEDGKDWS